ncbi:MAG: hypothetical protein ABR961_14350 [Thermoanaerobaculaceae bacterium]
MTEYRRARAIWPAVVILGASAVLPRPLHAATPSEMRSLRGLPGVEVVFENLTEELQGLGLNAEVLRGEVESKLRDTGVRVLTAEDQASGRPWLYVRISALKSSNVPLVSYYVSAQLRQDVTLDRNPDLHVGGTTWEIGGGGLAGNGVIVEAVRGAVRELAEKFSTDFLAVNNRH